MTEEVQETPINTIEAEATPVQVPAEVPAEVPVPQVEKPRRKGRKAKEEESVEVPTVKRKVAKKKAEKVEVIAVEAMEEQPATAAPAPTPEPLVQDEDREPTFKEVQKSMTELQAEFRRLRREQKTTHYKKMLEGKI
jgi:hypothetical protein